MKARICGTVGLVALAVLCAAFQGEAAARGAAAASGQFEPACDIAGAKIEKSGGTATVLFNVESGCQGVEVSWVSSTSTHPTWDESWALEEKVFDSVTQTFPEGHQSLTVKMPDCYYELDFVYGKPIPQLGPPG